MLAFVLACMAPPAAAREADRSYPLAPPDHAFLDDLEWRAVRYFIEQADARTGLALDRASVDGLTRAGRAPSSVAATGFAPADPRGGLPMAAVVTP